MQFNFTPHFLLPWALACVLSTSALAVETTDVLPASVRSVSVRLGTVAGLNQQYTNSGDLKYLSDINSTELDARKLGQIEPSVNDLIQVLNNFGHAQLGNQINLGHLYVDADPEVSYFAPVFLYGVTDRLTLGVAVPVVKYTNGVDVGQAGSNLSALRREVGGLIPEIDAAFNQLDRDMRQEFRAYLQSRGYKPLNSVNRQFLGDVQVVAAYQFRSERRWAHASQFYLTLPTGPTPDPDDLTDIESFGRWAARAAWISAYALNDKSSLVGSVSYMAVLPERIDKRVPLNAEDTLPDASQKMRLTEDIGDSLALTGGWAWKWSHAVTNTLAYSYESKATDAYYGAPGGREQYLERGTHRQAHIAKVELGYSSIDDFKNKRALAPWTITYELSQVLSGINVENQTRHELSMSLYF